MLFQLEAVQLCDGGRIEVAGGEAEPRVVAVRLRGLQVIDGQLRVRYRDRPMLRRGGKPPPRPFRRPQAGSGGR